ncbi:DUF4325 domain-containing protein [Clostridium perfringens]
MEINVMEIIGSSEAISLNLGDTLYKEIKKQLNLNSKEIIIDFKDIEELNTLFLDASIGRIFKECNNDILLSRIRISGLNDEVKYSLMQLIIFNATIKKNLSSKKTD